MTKFSVTFIFNFITILSIAGQKSYIVDTLSSDKDLSRYNSGEWYNHRKIMGGLEGTGFIFEEFMPGQIFINDTTLSTETYLMNVDAYTNEVKYMQDGKEYTIYNTNKYTGVLMKDSLNQRYVFKRMSLSEKDKTLYLLEVMHQGAKFKLYKHLEKRLHRADLQDRGIVSTGKSLNSFDEYEDYFIKKAHRPVEKINLKRNSFFELAASSKLAKLEIYCTDNKIGKNLTELQAVQLMCIIENL